MKEPITAIESDKSEKKDANTLMALGTGVGVLGTASAVVAGAVCPLCIFVAPGLFGIGAFKRWRLTRKNRNCVDPKVIPKPLP